VPSSINIPFKQVLTPDDTFLPPAELEKLFKEKRVQLTRPIVTM
jgi:3-mercaptopyruvate sulfurtransferase SseA